MSDNRLNLTGLTYFYNRLKQVFATQTALNTLSDRVDDIVAEGGEPNVIESISLNGTAVTPDANKNVALTAATFDANGHITDGSYSLAIDINSTSSVTIENDGGDSITIDMSAKQDTLVSGTNIKTVNSVSLLGSGDIAVGGAIDTISVNGTQQTITNKNVDLTVPDVVAGVAPPPVPGAHDIVTASIGHNMSGENAEGLVFSKMSADYVQLIVQGGGESHITELYTGDYIDANLATKASVPTKVSDLTNDGDGTQGSAFATTDDVTDAIDARISSTYKAKGSVAFANLPALAAANEGNVYDVTDSFTTTADFAEGAGNTYPAGTNVVIINTGTEQNPVYKYDVLAGFVDLSDYWNSTNLTAITTAEIDAMMAS